MSRGRSAEDYLPESRRVQKPLRKVDLELTHTVEQESIDIYLVSQLFRISSNFRNREYTALCVDCTLRLSFVGVL